MVPSEIIEVPSNTLHIMYLQLWNHPSRRKLVLMMAATSLCSCILYFKCSLFVCVSNPGPGEGLAAAGGGKVLMGAI